MFRPRRVALNCLAVVLGCVWLANALLSVLFRQSVDVETLRGWMAITLSAYVLWHVVRVACFRPEHPLELTDEQRELFAACPLRGQDLVAYHLAGTLAAAWFKASCVALLLLPDLPRPLFGFIGVFLALWGIDLLRIALEIVTWAMSHRSYLLYRMLVLGSLVTGCVLGAGALREATTLALGKVGAANPFAPLLAFVSRFENTPAVHGCRSWWDGVLKLITSDSMDVSTSTALVLLLAIAMVLAWGVGRLHGAAVSSVALREQRNFRRQLARAAGTPGQPGQAAVVSQLSHGLLVRPRWLSGIGPLAWRQSLGASRYAGGLLSALVVPAALSLIPLFAPVSSEGAFLSVVGGLAFYSFLLLPTALRFDFRRDLDRLALLKTLPINKLAAVVGQVSTPVLVAGTFQLSVLSVAQFVRPVAPSLVFGAVLLLALLDVLIFALENLIFLWYPHRLQQEGLDVFLRTTLTFTAKGVLFTLALFAVVAWSGPARQVADKITRAVGHPISGYSVFFVGVLLLLASAGGLMIYLLAQAYEQFDPAEDRPL
jgi:hypothetical protein